MDCPHCGEESLLGARICAACGRNMLSAPPPFQPDANATATQAPFSQMPTEPKLPQSVADAQAAAPSAPRAPAAPPATEGGPPVQTMCRVCQEGFDRPHDETGVPICPACRQFAPVGGGDAGVNDVTMHPATQTQPGVDPRSGGAIARRKPVRRASLRVGPIAATAGLVLVLSSLAVVVYVRRDVDPAAEYLADVRREDAAFTVSPSKEGVTRLETTLQLNIVHEMVRAAFSSRLEEVLNLRQKSIQTADVAWVRDDGRSAVLDAFAECRVAMQTGTAANADARELKAYPWEGFKSTAHVSVSRAGPTLMTSGDVPVPGRDVTPCLTVSDIGAPSGTVTAGTAWRAPLTLPLLANRDGALRPTEMPCEITYDGRMIQGGVSTYLFSVRGTVSRGAAEHFDEMNRASGTVRGVLFYEAKTGLLYQAHLSVDASVWMEKGRVEDRVHVEGTLDSKRP
jgi:hypothetical protein